MSKSDDRMLWIRNLERAPCNVLGFDTIEAELGSESDISGLLDYADSAIQCARITHSRDSSGLHKYLLRLPLPQVTRDKAAGTRKGYLFREGQVGELVALMSLHLQVRLYILSTTVGQLTSHSIPIKSEFAPMRGCFGSSIDPVIFSSAARNFATGLPHFLDQIRAIPPKHHLTVALAANHYARALREVGVDKEMVFVRLVAAIETASQDQPIPNDALAGKTRNQVFRTDELTPAQIAELEKLLQTRRAKARFISFLEQYSSGFFEGEPTEPPHTQVTPATLTSVAAAIYDARSDYLHNGYPMYLSHYHPNFPEGWHMDPSVGLEWQGRRFKAEDKLPRADFFHRLVRHCLLAYFKSLVPSSGIT